MMKLKVVFYLILFTLPTIVGFSQVFGPANVTAGQTHTYSYMDDVIYAQPIWTTSLGSVINTWHSGITYYVSITWNVSGSGSVAFQDGFNQLGSLPVTVAPGAPAPPSVNNGSTCGPGTVTLSGTPTSGCTLRWFNAPTRGTYLGEGNTFTTPFISVTTTYYAASYNPNTAQFSSRVAATANVISVPTSSASATNNSRCGTGTITLSGTPGADANNLRWYTAATGGSLVNLGLTYGTTLSTTTTYYIVGYQTSTGCESNAPRVPVVATINSEPGLPAGVSQSICGSGTVTLTGTSGSNGNAVRWYSASTGGSLLATSSSYTTPNLSATTTYYISSYNTSTLCESISRVGIVVTVNPIPSSPTGGSGSVCGSGAINLSGVPGPNSNTLRWYAAAIGGSPLATATSYTTPSLSASTTYYISSYNSTTLCESTAARVAITATVNPVPASPSGTPASRCGTGTITLTATPGANGNTVRWYAASTGGSPLATATSYTTPSLSATTTYYISSYNSTTLCESTAARIAITASVNSVPGSPSGTSSSRCGVGTLTLTATTGANGNTVRWYAAATGGSPLATTTSYTTPSLSITTTYYISSYNSTTLCESTTARVAVTATIKPIPASPTANGANRCGPGTLTLAATSGANGNTVRWYSAATGGSPLTTATNYTTPNLSATTTYYISSYNSITLCESTTARVAVTATVNSIPTAPGYTGHARFGTGPLTLTGTGTPAGGTYKWYNSANVYQSTGTSYTTGSVSANTNNYMYMKAASSSGCESTSTAINILVYSQPVVSAPQSYVVKESNVTMTAGAGYETYSWKNAANTVVATTQSFTTNVPSTYTVTVTKTGAIGVSNPFVLSASQFSGMNKNYIVTNTTQIGGLTDANTLQNLSAEKVAQQVAYFDGLGRPTQTISTQGSVSKTDLVAPVVYDDFGRETKKYLPVVTGHTGRYKDGLLDAAGNYLVNTYNNPADKIADDTRPFSETLFEASPLNRPDKEYGAGLSWGPTAGGANKFIQHAYLINSHSTASSATQEKVIAWNVSVANLPVRATPVAGYVVTGGYYASGQLQIKSTKDEEGNEVREYTDKLGRVILKKVQAAVSNDLNNVTQWALTYYVYDDLVNLRLVLPPELSKLIHTNADTYVVTATDLNNWAFQYKYDGRKRMIEKQVPGAGAVYIVYDNRDRLVLTQDANQRALATKYWSFTKYDELNRPIMTGIKDTSVVLTQTQMQAVVNAHFAKAASRWGETYVGNVAGNVHEYTNKAYPVRTGSTTTEIDPNKYLSVTYYDNYSFRSLWYGTYTYLNESLSEVANGITYQQPATENLRVIGQVTGTKTKVLDGGVTGGYTWLKSVSYYDDKYRIVQTLSDNYKGGTDRVTNVIDFVGKVLKSKSIHTESDVAWRDVVSVRQEGNKLISVAGPPQWGFGCASLQQLAAGQDGWFEFTVTETTTSKLIGFNDSNSGGTSPHDLNYAFQLYYATLYIQENANVKGTLTGLIPGDILRMERVGTIISFKRNGIPITTSALTPSTTALFLDNSFHIAGNTIADVRASFATTTKTTTRRFEYDHAGRLLKTWHKLDTQPEILLALNEYNDLGQLVDKKIHSTVSTGANAKQSVDYRYNIRGWLTSMNDASLANTVTTNDDSGDLFGMNLEYNKTDLGLGNTPLFNGNISAMTWSNNLGLGTTKQNGYAYSYDKLNRIKTSVFKEKNTAWSTPANNALQETGFNYDLNGNITTLQRNDRRASGWMDNLAYTYIGNQLVRVIDTGDDFAGFIDGNSNANNDYTYDVNGNLTRDLNKGIGTSLTDPTNIITYNYLNLPETVTKGGNSIRYIYDASGRKLSQVTTFGSKQKQTDYVGEYQYENDVLQFVSHEEGRIAIANIKTIVNHTGDALTNLTAATATLANVTQNGNTYVRATANGTSTRQGIFPIGGTLAVQTGEQYRIRAKGYRPGPFAVYISIRTNNTDLNWPGAQLANSLVTEAYSEQVITIPPGHTTLEVGVVWDNVGAGQQFFLNDFEITKLTTNTTPEYQYNLKDHLGNVRLSFTSKVDVEATTATLENANINVEQSQFLRYENAKRINASIFDRTNGSAPTTTTGYSERLNGSANEKYGLAKSISVMPGDVINTEVYAKYVDPVTSNWTAALNSLMGQIAANTAGVVVDGASYGSSTASFPSGFIGLQNTSNTGAPRAYLNWLIFDRNYVFITGGFKQIGTVAKEAGTDVPHELIASPTINITQPGYVYIYLSNENPTPVEVYFDDFKVTHTKSPVIQTDDYYAFGLAFNSYRRENTTPNQYLYNSMELQDELNLVLYDYLARKYDPMIGRFTTIDPHSENYLSWAPFNYVANNPIILTDPTGMDWYQDEKGNTMWKKGSDEIEGYKNIGENYSYRQGDVTYSYQQSELATLEEHVLEPGDWKTSQTTNADGSKKQCYTSAKEMVSASGAETLGGQVNGILTGTESKTKEGHKVTATEDAKKGVDYVNSQVDQGKSVAVGVDYAYGKGINDKSTDHWVAISSRVTDLKSGTVSFNFYDPGTSRAAHGRSGNFSVNSKGLMAGAGKISGSPGYTVTQVRKNK